MARIVGGLACSHAPSIAHSYDRKLQKDPIWAPLYDGWEPAKAWLSQLQPDLMVVDLQRSYEPLLLRRLSDLRARRLPTRYPQADEGWGTRDFPDFPGHARFSWHLAQSLIEDEFDPTICQEMTVDHGILSILPLLTDTPLAGADRADRGQRDSASAADAAPLLQARPGHSPGDREISRRTCEVLVVSTGGMSHQLHGPRFGFLNPEWDNEFMDKLESDPVSLTGLSHHDYMERGGAESVEIIMWLAMRAALGDKVRRIHRHYYAPMLTGYGLVVFEGANAA